MLVMLVSVKADKSQGSYHLYPRIMEEVALEMEDALAIIKSTTEVLLFLWIGGWQMSPHYITWAYRKSPVFFKVDVSGENAGIYNESCNYSKE